MPKKVQRFGLIAGSGQLPVALAKQLRKRGEPPTIVGIAGQYATDLTPYGVFELPLEKIAYCLPHFQKNNVTDVILAGGVKGRPKASAVRFPFKIWRDVPGVFKALSRGDDGLLALLVKMFERHDIKIVGAHEILADHVAPLGLIAGALPARSYNASIQAGVSAAAIIGIHDIGQAVVALGRRVIAVEGIEGTDQMLSRIATLRLDGRIDHHAQPVLVKLAKPGQELRADMPVIGPATIDHCIVAGIRLICIGAGTTMILEVATTLEKAQRAGISIIGIEPADWRKAAQ